MVTNLTQTYLGQVDEETLKSYPALTYMMNKKAAQDAGLDYTDPAVLRGVGQSNAMKQRYSKVSGRSDQRTLERITNMKIDFAPLEGSTPEQLEASGYAGKESALNALQKGRGATFRQFLDQQQKLEGLAGLEAEIRTKRNRAEKDAVRDIDDEIAQTTNQMLTARSMLITSDQLKGLSPAQQNQIISAQQSFFQTRLDNLESLRTARLDAVDDNFRKQEESSERERSMIEARIEGLEKTISYLEDTVKDQDAAADLRIKLAQERKKLKKGSGKNDTSIEDTILMQMINDFIGDEESNPLGKEPSTQQLNIMKMRAKQLTKNRETERERFKEATKGSGNFALLTTAALMDTNPSLPTTIEQLPKIKALD